MSKQIRVNQREMLELIDALKDNIQQIENTLDALTNNLNELSHSWTGQASRAYQTAQNEWLMSINGMKNLLEQYRTRTINVQEQFKNAAAQTASIWS